MIKGKFRRAPIKTGELKMGWFAISHHWIKDIAPSEKLRGKWYFLQSSKGSDYRILRFDPKLKYDQNKQEGELSIDWDGGLKLFDDPGGLNTQDIQIKPIRFLRSMNCGWNHPDPSNRLPLRIAIVLGGLSVLLGLISFIW